MWFFLSIKVPTSSQTANNEVSGYNFHMNKVAVVLVDMQIFFLKNLKPDIKKELIANQLKVINFSIAHNIPLIVLEYKAGGILRGKTTKGLQEKIQKISRVKVLIKESNSGFTKTNLDQILKEAKITKLVLMGINANGCVQDTAIAALRRKYTVASSKGIIANTLSSGMELSKKNKDWYMKNTEFFENVDSLLLSLN